MDPSSVHFLYYPVTIRNDFRLLGRSVTIDVRNVAGRFKMTREESIAFYKAHSKRLYNISLRIVHDSGEAEEIMQDTIMKYIMRPVAPSGFFNASRASGAEAAWLAKTCIRASIDALRRRKRERLFLDEYAAADNEDTVYADEEISMDISDAGISRIREAISGLKDPYRLVLDLVLIEGLDYEEISRFTGEREGTVRTQYSRARKMLAARLTEKDETVR